MLPKVRAAPAGHGIGGAKLDLDPAQNARDRGARSDARAGHGLTDGQPGRAAEGVGQVAGICGGYGEDVRRHGRRRGHAGARVLPGVLRAQGASDDRGRAAVGVIRVAEDPRPNAVLGHAERRSIDGIIDQLEIDLVIAVGTALQGEGLGAGSGEGHGRGVIKPNHGVVYAAAADGDVAIAAGGIQAAIARESEEAIGHHRRRFTVVMKLLLFWPMYCRKPAVDELGEPSTRLAALPWARPVPMPLTLP